jgi:hypothetical protein
MKSRLFVLSTMFLVIMANAAVAQNALPLTISEVSVTADGRTFEGTPTEVMVTKGRWSPVIMLASGGGVIVDARYKARRFRSRISANKASGIQMKIRYRCYLNGSMKTIKMTRNFFGGNSRSFEETQKVFYTRGLLNSKVEFSYTGKLPV